MHRRLFLLLVWGVAVVATPLSGATPNQGGTFLVDISAVNFDSIDLALTSVPGTVPVLSTVCASLMRLPDKPLPDGFHPVPELAADFPKISPDGKTYIFTIRKGLRFSTGAPVTARDVAYTIDRILSPTLKSPNAAPYQSIVGAGAVIAGKTSTASGIVASGQTLTIRLTQRVGDFVAGAASSLCVLPEGLPIDPEGVKAPVPTAAPYYISEYVPSQRVVLDRNRFYRGSRPQHVDRFVVDLTVGASDVLDQVIGGKADFGWVPNASYAARAGELAQRFGVNKAQFFVKPGQFLRMFVLNTSRPLLRNNVQLRQAINYTVDRAALLRQFGAYAGTPTDQFLLPIMPGFTNAHIYPLYKPDLAKARALAKGHTRSGKLVLYTPAIPLGIQQAQIVKQNLKQIGLDVEIMEFPPPLLFQKLATRGEPFDMGWIGWGAPEPDPVLLSQLFDGSTIGTPTNINWSYFNSPKWNRALEQASQLTGEQRYRAYGELDVELARAAAPAVAYADDNAMSLVSARTGCVVVNPYLDLEAVCLK